MPGKPASKNARKGGKAGNQNARKHGFYAKNQPPVDPGEAIGASKREAILDKIIVDLEATYWTLKKKRREVYLCEYDRKCGRFCKRLREDGRHRVGQVDDLE